MTVRPICIVVLAKYWEVFKGFLETSELYAAEYPKILVKDEGDIPIEMLGGRWTVLEGQKPFSMAGNGNLGLKAVSSDSDILYCGDDIRFFTPSLVERIHEIAYSDPAIGILTPRIIGRGSPSQVTPMAELSEVPPIEMWFPCIYIKREVIDKVGYLDERFNDFGSDDLDYCLRVKKAGYKLCVTSKVAVKHEASPEGGPTTFVKNVGVKKWQQQQAEAQIKLVNKYNIPPSVMDRVVRTGDVSLLEVKPDDFQKRVSAGYRPSNDECRDFLQSRWIFIGTPAYGGQCAISYVNSLISLIDLCRDIGIKHTVSFTQNESLVTRARNKLADDFLKTEATDLFWIDADIGFDAKDVVLMMMRDEGVIGFPCVRKNLRIDRVVKAVKKNGADYSIEELEKLMGEFVMNFPKGKVPSSINLGELIEVGHVGTGLMRIKRETFETIKLKIPNRWIRPMSGEAATDGETQYMFFQAEPDLDASPNEVPYYLSEDFGFCILCKKAGIPVYMAPWPETSHTGQYIFKGDLKAVGAAGGFLR